MRRERLLEARTARVRLEQLPTAARCVVPCLSRMHSLWWLSLRWPTRMPSPGEIVPPSPTPFSSTPGVRPVLHPTLASRRRHFLFHSAAVIPSRLPFILRFLKLGFCFSLNSLEWESFLRPAGLLHRDVLCGWGATDVAGDRKTDGRR